MKARWAFATGLALLVAEGAMCPLARAEGSPDADAAFEQGVALMKRGDCPGALQRFRQSNAIEVASGTLLDIAYCQAALGRSTAAWLSYRRVIPLATASGKPEHAALAREQAEKLETELPELVIGLPPDERASVSVLVDGESVPFELLGGVPVSPGAHRVEALRDGASFWKQDVRVEQRQRLDVAVPAATRASGPSAAAPVASTPTTVAGPAHPAAEAGSTQASPRGAPLPRPSRSKGSLGLPLAVVGAAGLAGSAVLFTVARVRYDSAAERCPNQDCQGDGAAFDQMNSARSLGHVSLVLAGVSALVLGTGAVVWFTSPRAEARDAHGPALALAAGFGSVSMLGQF